MKIIPIGDRLLVKLNTVEERKVGHIYMPDKHKEESRTGEILAIGDSVKGYAEKDRVLVSYYSGIVIHLVNEGYLDDTLRIFSEREILAKIEDFDG